MSPRFTTPDPRRPRCQIHRSPARLPLAASCLAASAQPSRAGSPVGLCRMISTLFSTIISASVASSRPTCARTGLGSSDALAVADGSNGDMHGLHSDNNVISSFSSSRRGYYIVATSPRLPTCARSRAAHGHRESRRLASRRGLAQPSIYALGWIGTMQRSCPAAGTSGGRTICLRTSR